MIDLEKIKLEMLKNKPIEEILRNFNWREFEEIVAEIFRRNEFKVKQNFKFKIKKKHEIDLLAVKQNLIFCVDCKKWSSGRYKKSGIKIAATKQEKRTRMVRNFLKKNPIAMRMLKIGQTPKFYSLIVTLMEEDIIQEKKTFIVPIFKLNSFLLESERHLY